MHHFYEGLQWKQGEDSVELKDRSELYDWINERSPLGLLAALDGFRRFLEQGPKKFGETFYLGAMPLAGDRPLRNCLVGNDGELELRWLTHPVTHRLEVMEVFADRDLDPLEVWFRYEDETNGQPLMPVGIDLRYGTESILELKVETWESEVQKAARHSWLGRDAFALNGRLKSTAQFATTLNGYRGGDR
ncbi:MAG: hypothetical protein VXZ38_00790 [Planctomycetota bacterium]|nr:hypothetical protein [Planctomycetota bacterium]